MDAAKYLKVVYHIRDIDKDRWRRIIVKWVPAERRRKGKKNTPRWSQ